MNKGIDELIDEIIYTIDEENSLENINEKWHETILKLNNIKSLYDMSEKDYIKKCFNIEYYKDLIILINKKIIENNTIDNLIIDKDSNKNKSKDNSLINNLIPLCRDLINKHMNEYNKEINKKLFLNLENKFKKISQNEKIKNNNNSIIENSNYEQSSKNKINTTVLLSDIKNNFFKYNNNKLNKTNSNINNININNTNNYISNLNETFNFLKYKMIFIFINN